MMKFVVLIALLFFNRTYAQEIDQGKMYVAAGSNLSLSSTEIEGSASTFSAFNIELRGGYFLAKNILAGVIGEYGNVKQGSSSFEFSTLGFFGRYYLNGTLFFGGGYTSTKVDHNDRLGNIPLELGYALSITESVTIEPSLVYEIGTGDNETTTSTVNIAFGLYF